MPLPGVWQIIYGRLCIVMRSPKSERNSCRLRGKVRCDILGVGCASSCLRSSSCALPALQSSCASIKTSRAALISNEATRASYCCSVELLFRRLPASSSILKRQESSTEVEEMGNTKSKKPVKAADRSPVKAELSQPAKDSPRQAPPQNPSAKPSTPSSSKSVGYVLIGSSSNCLFLPILISPALYTKEPKHRRRRMGRPSRRSG